MTVNYEHAPRTMRTLGGEPIDDTDGWQRSETGLYVPPKPTSRVLQAGIPIAIELFAGAGGMALGTHQAGFWNVAASEYDEWAALTFLTNLGAYPCDVRFVDDTKDRARFEKALRKFWGMKKGQEWPENGKWSIAGSGWLSTTRNHQPGSCAEHITHDDPDEQHRARLAFCDSYHAPPAHRHGCQLMWIGDCRELSGSDFLEPLDLEPGQVDLVAGGPPCQGFSHAGQRQVMDPRNSLVFEFTRLVSEIQPKALMMENVPGMASMHTPDGINVVDAIAMDLDARGYGVRDALSKALHASAGTGLAAKTKRRTKTTDTTDIELEPDQPLEEQLDLLATP
jgi:DNA (cytosine-5)-methyltransferase 1